MLLSSKSQNPCWIQLVPGLAESIREDPTLPRYGTDCIQVARQHAAPFSWFSY
jgi:hypothetical protein